MVNWLGLAIPVAYLSILLGSLATFSSLYRRRKAAAAASLEPWFPPHLQRDIYLSLLHIEPSSTSSKSAVATTGEKSVHIPDSVLKAALLERACEDIRRIVTIRTSKAPLGTLLQRGSVGDELWQRFLRAEKEIEAEVRDVVEEANALQAGWGQWIFQSANEMVNNTSIRDGVTKIQAKVQAERQRYEKERAEIQSEFMKELDADGSTPAIAAPPPPSLNTTANAATPAAATGVAVNSPGSSAGDDDAVFVDAVAAAAASPAAAPSPAPSTGSTGGKFFKRKKGKKSSSKGVEESR